MLITEHGIMNTCPRLCSLLDLQVACDVADLSNFGTQGQWYSTATECLGGGLGQWWKVTRLRGLSVSKDRALLGPPGTWFSSEKEKRNEEIRFVFKSVMLGLEIWFSGYECRLLLKKSGAPATGDLKISLTSICKSDICKSTHSFIK